MLSSITMTTADQQQVSDPQEKPAHFPFLSLTRELRDLVYNKVLKGLTASSPSIPDVFGDERTDIREHFGMSRVMYPPFPAHVSSALSLMLLNRQVHSEVKEILSKSRPMTYRLDILSVEGRVLYPTWLSVPVLSSHVDIVEANLRLETLCTHERIWKMAGDGGLSYLPWSLHSLMNRFLSRGADFLSEPPKATSTTIGLLVLNLVTPPDGAWSGRGGSWTPLEMIAMRMSRFARMLLHDEPGEMMREKVGVIRVCCDGHQTRTIQIRQPQS